MPVHLSDEWFDEFAAAVAGPEVAAAAQDLDLAVGQVVTTPDGPVRWRLVARAGEVRLDRSTPPADADVVFSMPIEVAQALFAGETNALAAVQQGDIEVSGDTDRLVAAAPLFAAVEAANAHLRATTTFG